VVPSFIHFNLKKYLFLWQIPLKCKICCKVYFTDGWEILKRFYKIFSGTWITLVYANRHLFLLEVRNFHGQELVYPQFTPPKRLLLENQSAYEYISSFVRYGSNSVFLPTEFCHVMVKELTEADVTNGKLVSLLLVL